MFQVFIQTSERQSFVKRNEVNARNRNDNERDKVNRQQLVIVTESAFRGQSDKRIRTERRRKQGQTDWDPMHLPTAEEKVVIVFLLVGEVASQANHDGQVTKTDHPVDKCKL